VIEIRNLLFQPLTFQLVGGDRGLHLGSRQRKPIEDAQVSGEIRIAAKRGFVALTVLEQPGQPEAQPAASEDVVTQPEAASQPSLEPVAEESVQAPDEPATFSEDGGAVTAPETAEQPVETTDQTPSRKRR
jgi:hypothetical protein